ncbi:MAG: hypothetical protein HC852_24760 [Acaryochloridaceae cyanobacterium RU_4_10]|nr:hypothetical protein [Acaryochloridaceae cyanobacterium RU_4_10]
MTKGSPEENLRAALEKVTTPQMVAEASTIAPEINSSSVAQTRIEALQAKAAQAKETLELAQKNLTTFTKHVKHRGLRAWAKEQMPILQNKAAELIQAQAAKDWRLCQGASPDY